jgi:hypothetical protein
MFSQNPGVVPKNLDSLMAVSAVIFLEPFKIAAIRGGVNKNAFCQEIRRYSQRIKKLFFQDFAGGG